MQFPLPLRLAILSLILLASGCAPSAPFREAQNLSAKPFNQLDLAGNACGPAALLNSYRFGEPDWRKLSEEPLGLSDRERIRAVARGPAMRESSSLPGRARWSRNGINISDLRDVANEISAGKYLPHLKNSTLVASPNEAREKHLRRLHSKLANSLSRGIPPILSVRLFAKRAGKWTPIQGHFVTVTSVPARLEHSATSFSVKFIDPMGGKLREGAIQIGADPAINFFTEANFPGVTIGRASVRSGEDSYLAAAAVLGYF